MNLLKEPPTRLRLWLLLGLLSLIPYGYAFYVQHMRRHAIEFQYFFFAAFAIYLVAVLLVLHGRAPKSTRWLGLVFGFAVLYRGLLVFTIPSLSDDMYRYVWDGRMQANNISPYEVTPNSEAVQPFRDWIWQNMNRKWAVTVYPPAAEMVFAGLWRLRPDDVHWFQAVMAVGDLAGGLALIWLLRRMGRPVDRVLLYWWSPLLIFETAHSAHIDGLVMPFLIGAWLARAKGRDGWTGVLLGIATALKLYPALLLPALWRPRDDTGRWRAAWLMPLAFSVTAGLPYLPYLLRGANAIGYLPAFVNERFNPSLAVFIRSLAEQFGVQPDRAVAGVTLVTLIAISMVFLLRPARSAEQAIARCIWPIGAFTLLTQYLLPWYILWLLPLAAIFVRPGKFGLRLDAWTGWFLFTGLIALSYTFFIWVRPIPWTIYAQYVPLYALLILPALWIGLRDRLRIGGQPVEQRQWMKDPG